MIRTGSWTVVAIAVLSVACGGGGGGGGGASSSSASEGPVQGFGSVIVNGVRWETDDAEFEIDGRPGDQDDLEIGMVVRVEGSRRGGSATADRVHFDTRLRGPIEDIDDMGPDARVATVFGIRVMMTRSGTVFRRTSLDALQSGDLIDASGLVDPNGDLEATYVRRRGTASPGDEVKLYGTVESISGGSFLLRDTRIVFDDDDVDDDLEEVREGEMVRVEGTLLDVDEVEADEVEPFRRHRDDDDDFDEVEIQGIVRDFVSAAEFTVAGRPVDASGARLVPSTPPFLTDGARVEAKGRVNAEGVLIANTVRLRSPEVEIEAALASTEDVDPAGGSLRLLGIEIQVTEETELEDDLTLDDLRGGDFLEVEGFALPDGSVLATEIEREDDGDEVKIEGPVDFVDADSQELTVLGVSIPTDELTEFELEDGEELSEEEFYQVVRVGDFVEAEDREDGDPTSFGIADEVELEDEDLIDDDDDDSDHDDDDRDDD